MVQVKVSEGILEGEIVENKYGGKFCSFKGIPYAEPPVGDLRFKAPQPKKPWTGVRSAKEFGPVCYQLDPIASPNPYGSEDCLYLNVYTPSLSTATPLPVMVWIHGGAFKYGSGNDDAFGPEFLIQHNVIVVTLNYRLEALGFLCLDTEDIPGNAGMKDQVAALRWVHKNINNFGGDNANITIFGESAGGASTSFHLVSPMSKGLFKRAIVQSGTLTAGWAQSFEPREYALKLAKKLGCLSNDDKEIAEFLRSVPPKKLVDLKFHVIKSFKPYELRLLPVNEKKFGDNERFFYGDVCDVLRNGIHEGVEVMTGYTEDEGLMAYAASNLDVLISEANDYLELFVPKQIQLNHDIKTQLEVGRKVKEFYLKKDVVTLKNKDQLQRYFDMEMFVHNALLFTKIISNQTKVFLYKFTCKSERNAMIHLLGISGQVDRPVVSHADDLFYLFPMKVLNLPLDQDSVTYTYIQRMTTLWTNFAKFGNPTPDNSLGVTWSPYTVKHPNYLDIGNTLAAGTSPDAEDDAFWEALFKEYLPHWTAQTV